MKSKHCDREKDLQDIFKIDKKNPERLLARESSGLEFKESFSYKSLAKYAKTMAAFANCGGGYIIFGVQNSPHVYVGLAEKKLDAFKSIDPERITEELNNTFAPEIRYEMNTYVFKGKSFGYIFVEEAQDKPVMAIKNWGDGIISDGGIYYRYRGRSQSIRFPELRNIMNSVREKEQHLWMRHLTRIARIGVKDVGLFDIKSGTTTFHNGQTFYLDETILGKVAFIKEGEFSERGGIPTLRVIGDVKNISAETDGPVHIVRAKGICLENIIFDFLSSKRVEHGVDYVKQVCCESSANLPCYYYIYSSRKGIAEVICNLKDGVISRAISKRALIERLSQGKSFHKKCSVTGGFAAQTRRPYVEAVKASSVDKVDVTTPVGILRFCEAILDASPEELKRGEADIKNMLLKIFVANYETMKSGLSSIYRKAICWVDEALYKDKCKK